MSLKSITIIILELILNFLLLLIIKKLKAGSNKDNYVFIAVLSLIIFFTSLIKINNLLIIYFTGRLFKLDSKLIVKYLISYLLSFGVMFIILTINNSFFNLPYYFTILGCAVGGLFYIFHYYKVNYSKLVFIYFLLSCFLLYYFR